MKFRYLSFLCFALTLAPAAFAQPGVKDMMPPTEKAADEKKDTELEKYEKAIKDAVKHEGNLTLFVKEKEIFMEVDPSQLGKVFIIQATLASGISSDAQAGDPLEGDTLDAFHFERSGQNLLLIKPNYKFRWSPDNPLATASSRSFPNAILGTFKIEATHPSTKRILINITSMFSGTLFQIPKLISTVAGNGYSPDRENTGPEKVRVTKDLASVRMAMHFQGMNLEDEGPSLAQMLSGLRPNAPLHLADKRSIPLKVMYGLWFPKENGYVPRFADSRVGYFTSDYFNVDKFNSNDRSERLITRFDLRKKDPKAAMSEPVEPITWYIDSSVPEEYREAVRRGILFWNKAFEKIGYKDAVVVKDAPANDPDWDPADGRHNVIRWTISPQSTYAVAWFRTNPLTGQIMNAAVTFDANYQAMGFEEYFTTINGTEPRFAPATRNAPEGNGAIEDTHEFLTQSMGKSGWRKHQCSHAHGMAEQASFGWASMLAVGVKMPFKEYMNMMIADTIAHEVGHCLGLRHNFAASTYHTVSELATPDVVNKNGIASSFMDYTPVNTVALMKGGGVYYNPTVGPYDEWAIAYGYGDSGQANSLAEVPYLNALARRSGEKGLMYLTDEDADGLNPLAVRWDLGADTLEFLKLSNVANDRVIKFAIEEKTKNGQSYTARNQIILASLRRRYRLANMAVRLVGGSEFVRQNKGDVNERPTMRPVSAARQRAAMSFLMKEVLSVAGINLPQDVLFSLNQDPDTTQSGGYNAPLRTMIGMQQRAVLSQLVSAERTDAIIEAAFKTQRPQDRYTLVEHYNILFSGIFNEIGANKPITDMRRDLQRFMIMSMINQAAAAPGTVSDDVRVICSQALSRLETRIGGQLKKSKGLDDMTLLHLRDIQEQLQRYRQRQMTGNR